VLQGRKFAAERRFCQQEIEQHERLVTEQMTQMQNHMQALMDMATSKEKAALTRSSLEVKLMPYWLRMTLKCTW